MSPWGNKVLIENIPYDENSKTIRFTLAAPAMCLVRVGEGDGGPCYKSLFGWEPLAAGEHTWPWDGKDVTGTVEVWQRAKLNIVLDGFTLPPGAILLTGSRPSRTPLDDIKKRFPLRPPHGEKIYVHAMHKRDLCHDMTIQAAVFKARKSQDGLPILRGRAEVQVTAGADVNPRQLEREKIELYCFVDGELLFEGPYPELPAKLSIDTRKIGNGEHLLTINLRTFEDHVGTYSMKVLIQN